MDLPGVRDQLGWRGKFTTAQAPGAIRNGTPVVKARSEPGDAHQDGARARVLGSLWAPHVGFGYFVEFNDAPRQAVFVAGFRIEVVH